MAMSTNRHVSLNYFYADNAAVLVIDKHISDEKELD